MDLSKYHLHLHVGQRNIKTALAATLCALLYFLVGRNPTFACIGAIFGVGSDMDNSRLNGGNRFFGTIIGGLLGMLLFRLYIIFYPDGSKHLHILLPEEMLTPESTAVRRVVSDGGVNVNITYRAKKATTLLPPSALRGQENDHYVYLIQHDWGGFMSSATMKIVKTPVTVLEKSDKSVSISEDLSYQQLADREDRALTDGQTVMEYVQ